MRKSLDKEKDAERIKILFEPMNISNHFVVGVERGYNTGISVENYCGKVLRLFKSQNLSKDLKIVVLT